MASAGPHDRQPRSESDIKSYLLRVLCALMLASALMPDAAYGMALAYIDPLSGSVLLQVLAAGVLGALFSTKAFFAKVRGFARAAWTKLKRR